MSSSGRPSSASGRQNPSVHRQRLTGQSFGSASGLSRGGFGQIPLSSGELELIHHQQQHQLRKQRLQEIRRQETLFAREITSNYNKQKQQLQLQRAQRLNNQLLQQHDLKRSQLYAKYQFSLQNMGTAQRHARQKLMELVETAQMEKLKWQHNQRVVQTERFPQALAQQQELAHQRAKHRQEIQDRLEKLKELSDLQRQMAAQRAQRILQEESARDKENQAILAQRRAQMEQEIVWMATANKTPGAGTMFEAFQNTRFHCALPVVSANKASQHAPEIKVVKHNPRHPNAFNAKREAETFAVEFDRQQEAKRLEMEQLEAKSQARAEQAKNHRENEQDAAQVMDWLRQVDRDARLQQTSDYSQRYHPLHDMNRQATERSRPEQQEQMAERAFEQLFGLDQAEKPSVRSALGSQVERIPPQELYESFESSDVSSLGQSTGMLQEDVSRLPPQQHLFHQHTSGTAAHGGHLEEAEERVMADTGECDSRDQPQRQQQHQQDQRTLVDLMDQKELLDRFQRQDSLLQEQIFGRDSTNRDQFPCRTFSKESGELGLAPHEPSSKNATELDLELVHPVAPSTVKTPSEELKRVIGRTMDRGYKNMEDADSVAVGSNASVFLQSDDYLDQDSLNTDAALHEPSTQKVYAPDNFLKTSQGVQFNKQREQRFDSPVEAQDRDLNSNSDSSRGRSSLHSPAPSQDSQSLANQEDQSAVLLSKESAQDESVVQTSPVTGESRPESQSPATSAYSSISTSGPAPDLPGASIAARQNRSTTSGSGGYVEQLVKRFQPVESLSSQDSDSRLAIRSQEEEHQRQQSMEGLDEHRTAPTHMENASSHAKQQRQESLEQERVPANIKESAQQDPAIAISKGAGDQLEPRGALPHHQVMDSHGEDDSFSPDSSGYESLIQPQGKVGSQRNVYDDTASDPELREGLPPGVAGLTRQSTTMPASQEKRVERTDENFCRDDEAHERARQAAMPTAPWPRPEDQEQHQDVSWSSSSDYEYDGQASWVSSLPQYSLPSASCSSSSSFAASFHAYEEKALPCANQLVPMFATVATTAPASLKQEGEQTRQTTSTQVNVQPEIQSTPEQEPLAPTQPNTSQPISARPPDGSSQAQPDNLPERAERRSQTMMHTTSSGASSEPARQVQEEDEEEVDGFARGEEGEQLVDECEPLSKATQQAAPGCPPVSAQSASSSSSVGKRLLVMSLAHGSPENSMQSGQQVLDPVQGRHELELALAQESYGADHRESPQQPIQESHEPIDRRQRHQDLSFSSDDMPSLQQEQAKRSLAREAQDRLSRRIRVHQQHRVSAVAGSRSAEMQPSPINAVVTPKLLQEVESSSLYSDGDAMPPQSTRNQTEKHQLQQPPPQPHELPLASPTNAMRQQPQQRLTQSFSSDFSGASISASSSPVVQETSVLDQAAHRLSTTDAARRAETARQVVQGALSQSQLEQQQQLLPPQSSNPVQNAGVDSSLPLPQATEPSETAQHANTFSPSSSASSSASSSLAFNTRMNLLASIASGTLPPDFALPKSLNFLPAMPFDAMDMRVPPAPIDWTEERAPLQHLQPEVEENRESDESGERQEESQLEQATTRASHDKHPSYFSTSTSAPAPMESSGSLSAPTTPPSRGAPVPNSMSLSPASTSLSPRRAPVQLFIPFEQPSTSESSSRQLNEPTSGDISSQLNAQTQQENHQEAQQMPTQPPKSLADAFLARHPQFQQRMQQRAQSASARASAKAKAKAKAPATRVNTRKSPRAEDSSSSSSIDPSVKPKSKDSRRRVNKMPQATSSRTTISAAPSPLNANQQLLLDRLASGERAKVSHQEMVDRSRRLYHQLPEVLERKRQQEVLEKRQERLRQLREKEKARRLAQRQKRSNARQVSS